MASSNCWKLRALMQKNLNIMKRNVCGTIAEVFFPIILMILVLVIRKAFSVKKHYFNDEEKSDEEFTAKRSLAFIDFSQGDLEINETNADGTTKSYKYKSDNLWEGQNSALNKIFDICVNKEGKERYLIALVNVPDDIKNKLIDVGKLSDLAFGMSENSFKNFNSVDEMKNYVEEKSYGSDENPKLCFGISFQKMDSKDYEYHLHYFADYSQDGDTDIPMVSQDVFDIFRNGPNLDLYEKWYNSGFMYIQKIISEYILNKELQVSNAKINFVMRPQKYELYREDLFGMFVGYIVPFFIVIAYMCPLCLYVLRMVSEKETKAKEGMKIMGMSESIYFLSYFIQYFIVNLIQSIINSIIIQLVFKHVPYFIIFLTFFLWGACVFSLIFFFQSFIDRTRVALILSLLIYFVMFFMSMAVMNAKVKKILKIIISIFPPVGIELGIILFGKFESNFKDLKYKDIPKTYLNYSVLWMLLMFIIDFFLYLFLGFYLQNVVSHEFGIARPFYFLCTKSYWCGDDEKNKKMQEEMNNDNEKIVLDAKKEKQKAMNFQSEDLYKDKNKPDDVIKIRGIKKTFDDGKTAVNGVNLNLYKDEIFALLGHNGAGKTTLISMLCGMYDATGGKVMYDGENILGSLEMDNFRTKLGICPQHDVLFDDLTIKEHLNMFATFKGVGSDRLEEEVNITLKDFQLTEMQNIVAKDLSAGQRRKLSIAIALVGGSKVIFLDEPSSGMDITSRRNLWEILKRMTEKKIIILTTHYMEEASVLGNRIGIMHLGELKCLGTPLFLIERYGRFMSLRVVKQQDADNKKIITYMQQRAQDIEFEVLSEEIIFRIPKKNYTEEEGNNLTLSENSQGEKVNNNNNKPNFKLSDFFEELDANLKDLKIKNYSASMPTLEDVFLNVAADDVVLKGGHRKFSQVNEENDKILFNTDFKEDYSDKSKFFNDFKACTHKRWLMTIRDLKGVFLEILVPIFLIVVGLLVCQVTFDFSSKTFPIELGRIGKMNIYYGYHQNKQVPDSFKEILGNGENITVGDNIQLSSSTLTIPQSIEDFSKILYEKNDEFDLLGSMLILNLDDTNHEYSFAMYINTIADQGPSFFSTYYLNQIINHAVGEKISIKVINEPMPLTAQLSGNADQTTNSTMVFFVAVAFSLIPANFITIIVKERINNSKHLMRISGINMFAYWLVNFMFELLKYYFTAGVCLILIYALDFYAKYFVWFYLLYGPPMVAFTYCTSFIFDNEASAQNGTILLNFLIGALGSSVALMFRGQDNLKNIGKVLIYIFGIVPSFDMAYGYDFLLNYLLIFVNDSDTWYTWGDSKKISLSYGGMQLLYFAILTVVYIFILWLIEHNSVTFSEPPNDSITSDVNDTIVQNEIKRANEESNRIEVNSTDKMNNNNEEKYAVRIQNLKKDYKKKGEGCCDCCPEDLEAIKNLNLCVEYGECFGLLGINGAGKTTTFKCITQEHSATNGKIFINGVDISKRFSEISDMFGYCPQFDAIFEFMTVKENLEFYALIKGVKRNLLDKMIKAMIEEMSLGEFVDKISGRLSGGNKRKLSVAISMICNPPIILLDEPSTGMDPEARRFMWAVIHKISARRKKSAVIMTTHSMDEAETLCKRMGIMVNGEFVCLGSSNEIKDKYGYGYEIEMRIKTMKKDEMEKVLAMYNLDKKFQVTAQNVNEILKKINRESFIDELQPGKFGEKIKREIDVNGQILITQLISWTHYVRNSLKLIKKAKEYFDEIILTEYIENNFLYKIKKSENDKSIGFLFGLFEDGKDECHITEYSIQLTSLEQIFNKFAANQKIEGVSEQQVKKLEITITDELINKLITIRK